MTLFADAIFLSLPNILIKTTLFVPVPSCSRSPFFHMKWLGAWDSLSGIQRTNRRVGCYLFIGRILFLLSTWPWKRNRRAEQTWAQQENVWTSSRKDHQVFQASTSSNTMLWLAFSYILKSSSETFIKGERRAQIHKGYTKGAQCPWPMAWPVKRGLSHWAELA